MLARHSQAAVITASGLGTELRLELGINCVFGYGGPRLWRTGAIVVVVLVVVVVIVVVVVVVVAKPSSFTRAQRLATCMATLFLAMIANCMFFRSEDEQSMYSETISIGLITLTPQQISNSILSSYIN